VYKIFSQTTMITLQNFINGEFVNATSHLDSFNPSTGKVYAKVPDSDTNDVENAVNAACQAFTSWKSTTAKYRSNIILKIADLVEKRFDEFAEAESRDQGKPVWLAKLVDIPRVIHNFRFFATSILHETNISSQQPEFSAMNYTVKVPGGVAGLITPWNLPLYLLSFKLAPAIAAGCCVVAKPSEVTSMTAWMLCSVFREAGLPSGVVNMVFGTGPKVGSPMVVHPKINILSFTGSTPIGKFIQEKSAPFIKKISLELGGKNAGVIFDDADLEKCIPTSVRSAFTNQGEICLCTSRLFVQENIFDQFCTKYAAAVRSMMPVGPPHLSSSKVGALVSKEHLEKVRYYLKKAIDDGGKILCGESVDPPIELTEEYANGYYFQPTVVAGLKDTDACMQEEIFGPIVCITSFKDENEVIKRANDVPYGLSATLWSKDVSRIHRVAPQLDAGTIWCNCWIVRDLKMPFGGMKMSGIGREDQHNSLDFYSEVKTICVCYS